MNKVFFSIIPLFFVLLFSSCFLPQTEQKMNEEEYLIKVVGYNLPNTMKEGVIYEIPIKVYLGDTSINWSICLASFESIGFNVTGDRCVTKEYNAEEYDVYLPENGFIVLENPDEVLSETENIVVNVCYNYYNIFSLEGCVSKNEICSLNITGVLPEAAYINIESAEAIYDPENNTYYLRIYLYPSENESVFIGSKNEDISNCYVENFSGNYYNVTYTLRYGTNNVSGSLILKPGLTNQVDINITALGIDRNLPTAYFEFRIDYTVLQKVYLGSVNIEK